VAFSFSGVQEETVSAGGTVGGVSTVLATFRAI